MIDSLFGSKTRVKLLKLFMNNSDESYYVREATRIVDEQINSVRRELKNLVTVGVIKSRAVKNQLYYSANKDYKFFKEFVSIFSEDNTLTVKDTDEIAELKALGDIKLVIRTDKALNKNESVDLFIVGDNINKTRLALFLRNTKKGEEINYVTMDWDEFYYRKLMRDRVICDIVAGDPKILIDTENILTKSEE